MTETAQVCFCQNSTALRRYVCDILACEKSNGFQYACAKPLSGECDSSGNLSCAVEYSRGLLQLRCNRAFPQWRHRVFYNMKNGNMCLQCWIRHQEPRIESYVRNCYAILQKWRHCAAQRVYYLRVDTYTASVNSSGGQSNASARLHEFSAHA